MKPCSRCGGMILPQGPSHYAGPVCGCGGGFPTEMLSHEVQEIINERFTAECRAIELETENNRLRRELDDLKAMLDEIYGLAIIRHDRINAEPEWAIIMKILAKRKEE